MDEGVDREETLTIILSRRKEVGMELIFNNPLIVGLIIGIPIGLFLALRVPIKGLDYAEKIRKAIPYLRFVPHDKIEAELKKEGIVLDQNTRCSVCGKRITLKNFGAVRKKGDKKIFVCSNEHCMTLGKIITTM